MKIGKPSDIAAVSTASAAAQATASQAGARAASAAAPGRGRTAEAGAGVTVSVRSRSLAQAGLSAGSDIDMSKVEAVRAAIEQGTFKINPEVIADKLLANAKEMLGRRRA